MTTLHVFSDWLARTPVSLLIQTTDWAIPAVQTVHILCIGVVISAALMIHLRSLGLAMKGHTGGALAARFLPWVWWALVILLLSGAMLITAEPGRSLTNRVFQLKMLLLILAISLTLLYQQPLRKDPVYWEKTPARRANAGIIAILSLILWTSIVFAGRWIAYAIGT